MVYYCDIDGREYPTMPPSCLCECGNVLTEKKDPKIIDIQEPAIRGDNGLCILALDLSGSMVNLAFPDTPNYDIKKVQLVSSVLQTTFPTLKSMGKSNLAYIALIGFAGEAELLGIFRADELSEDKDYWKEWFNQIWDSFNDPNNPRVPPGTNLSSATKLAREIYDAALQGDLKKYGVDTFAPMYHALAIGSTVHDIANIRVFIYSDGEHESFEPFENHFEGASLIPGKSNVSGVIATYLGNASEVGYSHLSKIVGVCPEHGAKGLIQVAKPEHFKYMRQLFHMASATSGFCLECSKKNQSSRR